MPPKTPSELREQIEAQQNEPASEGHERTAEGMDVETTPEQPEEVVRVLVDALAEPAGEPDPWWRSGLEDALGE